MATLYITEFGKSTDTLNGVSKGTALVDQTVAIGGAALASAAFGASTRLIRIHPDVICSISIGAAPVATAVMRRLAANQTEYFEVQQGDKISVITNT